MDITRSVELDRAFERLRQERETFDQLKSHNARWFLLRFTMGWVSVILLPALMVVCSVVIFDHESYSSGVVSLAATGLLVDALGLVIAIWRVVLGVKGPPDLAPVTRALGDDPAIQSPDDQLASPESRGPQA